MSKHECMIGLLNDYDNTKLITINELKEVQRYETFYIRTEV